MHILTFRHDVPAAFSLALERHVLLLCPNAEAPEEMAKVLEAAE